nr:PAS sensor protein [Sinorhizobium meliloti]
MDVITAPVFGASGKPIRMLAIWRDVTELGRQGTRRKPRATKPNAWLNGSQRCSRARWTACWSSTEAGASAISKAMRLLQLDEHAIGLDLWTVFPADGNSVFAIEFRWAMADRSNVSFEEYLEPRGICLEMHAAPTSEGMSLFFREIT